MTALVGRDTGCKELGSDNYSVRCEGETCNGECTNWKMRKCGERRCLKKGEFCEDDGTCGEGFFSCGDGTCVPVMERCDGTINCPNGEDEQNCPQCDDRHGTWLCGSDAVCRDTRCLQGLKFWEYKEKKKYGDSYGKW